MHPSKKFFALGEKGTNPNVYIYEYPSLRLSKVLRGGTEQAGAYTRSLLSST